MAVNWSPRVGGGHQALRRVGLEQEAISSNLPWDVDVARKGGNGLQQSGRFVHRSRRIFSAWRVHPDRIAS